MKAAKVILLVASVLGLFGLVGYAFANAPEEGQMVGVIVAEKNAALAVEDQPGATGSVVVSEVKVPHDSWIVVHTSENGEPGKRLAVQHIEEGVSRDVVVALEKPSPTPEIIIAVHFDTATPGEFDFDMKKFATSPDKPYYVNGEELGREISVR